MRQTQIEKEHNHYFKLTSPDGKEECSSAALSLYFFKAFCVSTLPPVFTMLNASISNNIDVTYLHLPVMIARGVSVAINSFKL